MPKGDYLHMNTLFQSLGRSLLFFDGGMGSMLERAGLPAGTRPEAWNLKHPDIIRDIHLQYLRAGAIFLKTNTFGAHDSHLAGSGYTVPKTVAAGVRLAREAIAESGRTDVAVMLDTGSVGLLQPLGPLPFEEAVSSFKALFAAGAAAGADGILIETMTDLREIKAAVLAARETCALPVFVTVTADAQGRLLVDATLRCVDAPVIFGAGDAAHVPESVGGHLRASCAAAIPLGGHAADSVLAELRGHARPTVDVGFMVQNISLGRKDGVVQFVHADDTPRRFRLSGALAVWVKESICKMTVSGPRKEGVKPHSYPKTKGPRRAKAAS
jgi:hypothetical protein